MTNMCQIAATFFKIFWGGGVQPRTPICDANHY